MYSLKESTLFRTANTEDTAGSEVIWAMDYSTSDHRQHHNVEMLPNCNVLLIAWDVDKKEIF